MYVELRINLVRTVFASWTDTGFAWEQYSPDTGKGQRTQHFTGWTALIVNIVAMPEHPQPTAAKHSISLDRPIKMDHQDSMVLCGAAGLLLVCFFLRKRLLKSLEKAYENASYARSLGMFPETPPP